MVKDFLNEFYIRHAGIKSECADVLHSIFQKMKSNTFLNIRGKVPPAISNLLKSTGRKKPPNGTTRNGGHKI